jgi:small acid-soluble spore protein (thioredoxin-like protein)
MYIDIFMPTQIGFTFVEKKDSDDNVNRLKKTISNIEAAEVVKEFAEGAELAAIKAQNAKRKECIEGLRGQINKEKQITY